MAVRRDMRRASGSRERLVEAARGLYLRRGAAHVGINEVTEAAGVARMTLYNTFPSKEALTKAVYGDMAERTLADLSRASAEGASEAARIGAIFAFYGTRAGRAGGRGCPFIHASLQEARPNGSLQAIVRGYKRALRAHVHACLDRDRPGRELLADQIVILLDGAVTEAHLGGVADPLRAAREAARVLLSQPGP